MTLRVRPSGKDQFLGGVALPSVVPSPPQSAALDRLLAIVEATHQEQRRHAEAIDEQFAEFVTLKILVAALISTNPQNVASIAEAARSHLDNLIVRRSDADLNQDTFEANDVRGRVKAKLDVMFGTVGC